MPTTEVPTVPFTTESLPYACPLCDVFPFATSAQLGEHIATGCTAIRQGEPARITGSGRFQTQPNGFGGTTTVRVPEAKPARTNRYAGRCANCGTYVEAEAGRLEKGASGWLVLCPTECEPAAAALDAPAVPVVERAPLEPGMYRVASTIYKVQAARGTGNLYAKVLGGDAATGFHFDYAQGAINQVRREGERMSVDEAKAFGRETGTCCVCAAELTNPDSIAAGIGPICGGRV